MQTDVASLLRAHGIQPSAQRVAVARHVLATTAHPSADQVWDRVRVGFPHVSRATVYNTLHRLADAGLVRELVLAPGRTVYDPNIHAHHHFIDDATGVIHDVPWQAVRVANVGTLDGFEVREYQVVMRGRRTRTPAKPKAKVGTNAKRGVTRRAR